MTEDQAIALLQLNAAQVSLLLEIRDLIRDSIAAASAEDDPNVGFMTGCQHPEDSRIDLSTFGDLKHWVCKDCRFDNKAVA